MYFQNENNFFSKVFLFFLFYNYSHTPMDSYLVRYVLNVAIPSNFILLNLLFSMITHKDGTIRK